MSKYTSLLIIILLQVLFPIYSYGQDPCNFSSLSKRNFKANKNLTLILFKGSNDKYGLKNRSTNEVIIPAEYLKIWDNFKDSIFVVLTNKKKSCVININNQKIVPELEGFYSINRADNQIKYGSIMAYPPCIHGKLNRLLYVVDKNGNCILNDYYPCPPSLTDSIKIEKKHFRYIQEAEKYAENDINKSIEYYKKAIYADSLNPATYFSALYVMMRDPDCYVFGKGCDKYKKQYKFFEYCINKGLEIENDTHYLIVFNRYMESFYKYCILDKNKVKIAKKEIKRLRKLIKDEKEYWKW